MFSPCRPLSTMSPFLLHSATDSDADVVSGDSVSLARTISKDSLASNVTSVTPKHQTPVQQPQPAPARRVNGHGLQGNANMEDEEETLVAAVRTESSVVSKRADGTQAGLKPSTEPETDSFYLEPLMPAVLKTAKEKSVCLNKEEESGEGPRSSGRGSLRRGDGSTSAVRRKAPSNLNQTFPPPGEEAALVEEPPQSQDAFRPIVSSSVDATSREPAGGFYLHSDSEEPKCGSGPDADLGDLDEEDEDLDEAVTTKDPNWRRKAFNEEDEEEESAKLQEDMNVKEHEDKDMNGGSGRSSPCLSGHSQASSMASGSIRMTSFAERKAQQQRFGSNHDLRSSASSSQRTTPDGSESSGPLASSWRLKRDQSPSSPLGGFARSGDGANVLASELVQLRMQLEEKRRAIEHQKKKMEVLSARQRQKLGKAAFLHIVKKGGGKSDTLPNPLKADISKDEGGEKEPSSKDDMCVDALKGDKEVQGPPPPGALDADKKGNSGSFYLEEELDLNECSRSIELLNDAIGSIQQQMMQLSLQQEMLMKQNVQSPPGAAPPPLSGDKNNDSKAGGSYHYVEHVSNTGTAPTRKPPKLSSGRSSRSKPSELKIAKEQSRQASRTLTPTQSGAETLPHTRPLTGGRSPRTEQPDSPRNPTAAETIDRPGSGHVRSATYRLRDEANVRLPTRVDLTALAAQEVSFDECLSSNQREAELNSSDGSGRESQPTEEAQRSKALIEVDLSDLKAPEEEEGAEDRTTEGEDGEQKSGLGFFFKVIPSHLNIFNPLTHCQTETRLLKLNKCLFCLIRNQKYLIHAHHTVQE